MTEQTAFQIEPFDTRLMEQLNKLLPPEWSSNAYDLFMHNEWQPWFFPYQIKTGGKLMAFGLIIHHEDVGWLGWILVDPKIQRKGLGYAMTQFLIDKSKALGAKSIILTATEMGKPLYEKFGFTTVSSYRFFRPTTSSNQRYNTAVVSKAVPDDMKAITQLDLLATGEKRQSLLASHLNNILVHRNGDKIIEGFFVETLGTGLVIAKTEEAGMNLLKLKLRRSNSLIVLPDQNTIAINYLLSQGYTEGHAVPRMVLGEELIWTPSMIYCRASGYTG